MSKVIMIPENRYSRMVDTYDKAVSELNQIRKRLSELESISVQVLEDGEDCETVLEELFIEYASNVRYKETDAGAYCPISARKLLDWLEQNADGDRYEKLGEMVMNALADCEKQWFINGFRFASGIWKAC